MDKFNDLLEAMHNTEQGFKGVCSEPTLVCTLLCLRLESIVRPNSEAPLLIFVTYKWSPTFLAQGTCAPVSI